MCSSTKRMKIAPLTAITIFSAIVVRIPRVPLTSGPACCWGTLGLAGATAPHASGSCRAPPTTRGEVRSPSVTDQPVHAGEGVAVAEAAPGAGRQQVGLPPVGDDAPVALAQRQLRDRLAQCAADAEATGLGQHRREAQEGCVVRAGRARCGSRTPPASSRPRCRPAGPGARRRRSSTSGCRSPPPSRPPAPRTRQAVRRERRAQALVVGQHHVEPCQLWDLVARLALPDDQSVAHRAGLGRFADRVGVLPAERQAEPGLHQRRVVARQQGVVRGPALLDPARAAAAYRAARPRGSSTACPADSTQTFAPQAWTAFGAPRR